MGKSLIMLLILALALVPITLAEELDVCFDFDAPEAPAQLTLSGNVNLEWTPSVDGPVDCSSGVDYYTIYRNENLIGTTSSTTYKDSALPPGTYTYKVAAIDQVGNGEGAAITQSITIAGSSNNSNNRSSSTNRTSPADDWSCGNWSVCVNGIQTQLCFHKIMSGVIKTNTQNCTIPIIQQPTMQNLTQNQAPIQNQTQGQATVQTPTPSQTSPIMMINETQVEPAENLTGHNIIVINLPMLMPEEKEGTNTEETTLPGQGNNQEIENEEEDYDLTGTINGGSNVPWALIIFCVALIAATLVFVLMLRKPEKEEEKSAEKKKEEKWMELEASGGELEIPTPYGPPIVQREDEWVELNDIPVNYTHAEKKKEEKWIEIKVPAWRKRNAKKTLAVKSVKEKVPAKKHANKKKVIRKK